ncbi:hypothetical protein ACOJBO_13220 [Rhizobium beringeri]
MLSAGAIPRQNLQEREEIANGSVPIRYHPTTPDFSCMRTQPRHVAGAFMGNPIARKVHRQIAYTYEQL